jgi:hypothetical protein
MSASVLGASEAFGSLLPFDQQELRQSIEINRLGSNKDVNPGKIALIENSDGGYIDPFNGTELRDDWSIIDHDSEKYIVEDGGLLIVSDTEETKNYFQLNTQIPAGDWDMSAHIFPNFSTGFDGFSIQMREDKNGDDRLSASIYTGMNSRGCNYFTLRIHRKGSEDKSFRKDIWETGGSWECEYIYGTSNSNIWSDISELENEGAVLTLHK